MDSINVHKYELIQKVMDFVEDEYGIKATDKVDAEKLANICLKNMRNTINTMLVDASRQVEGKKHKITHTGIN